MKKVIFLLMLGAFHIQCAQYSMEHLVAEQLQEDIEKGDGSKTRKILGSSFPLTCPLPGGKTALDLSVKQGKSGVTFAIASKMNQEIIKLHKLYINAFSEAIISDRLEAIDDLVQAACLNPMPLVEEGLQEAFNNACLECKYDGINYLVHKYTDNIKIIWGNKNFLQIMRPESPHSTVEILEHAPAIRKLFEELAHYYDKDFEPYCKVLERIKPHVLFDVDKNATINYITPLFNGLALKWHPDKQMPEKRELATKVFQIITKARDTFK